MFDRGAPCEEYRGKMTARVTRERYGCRSRRCGGRLAGSSDNIRSVVARVYSCGELSDNFTRVFGQCLW